MIRIIPYSENYLDQYCQLYIDTWKVEPYGESFTKEEVANHLNCNLEYLYLLLENEILIGFVGGRPLSKECVFFKNKAVKKVGIPRAFYIDELGVKKSHKKIGFGYLLMQFLICVARKSNFNQFLLRTHSDHSNPAIGLYYKFGMKPRYTNNGKIHSVLSAPQNRIDGRPKQDLRIYFYKQF